jgi:hypothetical protein
MSISLDPTSWGGSIGDTASIWGTSLTLGADPSYSTPRTEQTQTGSALQLLQPVTPTTEENGWSGFWQPLIKGVVSYAIQKDAVQNGVQPVQQQYQPQPALSSVSVPVPNMANANTNTLVTLAVVGGLVFMAMQAGKG